ncbi:MAG: hypothetical protein PVF10_15570 [Syntrophobacterales bacterium]|jgi:hypothetical protein
MERKVREKGFIEKRDLKENLISQKPNLRVSGFRCQVSEVRSKESGVRRQKAQGSRHKVKSTIPHLTSHIYNSAFRNSLSA